MGTPSEYAGEAMDEYVPAAFLGVCACVGLRARLCPPLALALFLPHVLHFVHG